MIDEKLFRRIKPGMDLLYRYDGGPEEPKAKIKATRTPTTLTNKSVG